MLRSCAFFDRNDLNNSPGTFFLNMLSPRRPGAPGVHDEVSSSGSTIPVSSVEDAIWILDGFVDQPEQRDRCRRVRGNLSGQICYGVMSLNQRILGRRRNPGQL